jgi:hypothetical protein
MEFLFGIAVIVGAAWALLRAMAWAQSLVTVAKDRRWPAYAAQPAPSSWPHPCATHLQTGLRQRTVGQSALNPREDHPWHLSRINSHGTTELAEDLDLRCRAFGANE